MNWLKTAYLIITNIKKIVDILIMIIENWDNEKTPKKDFNSALETLKSIR